MSLKDAKFVEMTGFRCPKCNDPRLKVLHSMTFSDGKEVPEYLMCYRCRKPETLEMFQAKVPPGIAATWGERKRPR